VVIHSRAAAAETVDVLSAFEGTVVLHCFSDVDLLPVALDRGYFLSFAGNVTYPKAADLREAAAAAPDTRILVETDSPHLAPQAVRSQQCEPAFVHHTLTFLADVRAVATGDLEAQIDLNAQHAFDLP
jgi:TatD DNase family protein